MTVLMILASTLGLAITASGGASGVQDPCSAALPVSLRAAAQAAFPAYRLPNLGDLHLGRANQRGQECIAVAKGDFDGDGRGDYGVLLTARDGNSAVLVAALCAGDKWRLDNLSVYDKKELVDLYVTTATPGEYKAFEELSELRPGERRSFRSKHQGIVTGTLEASAIAYFWTPEGWIHVWISD